MNEDQNIDADQTSFQADPFVVQMQQKKTAVDEVVVHKKKISWMWMMIAVLLLIAGLILFVIVILTARTQQNDSLVASPSPKTTQVEVHSGIQTEIAPFFQAIDQKNPEENTQPFPPIDFSVRF